MAPETGDSGAERGGYGARLGGFYFYSRGFMNAQNIVAKNGIGFMSALFLVLLALKLTGHIAWSWWIVALPLYWWVIAVLAALMIVLIVIATINIFLWIRELIQKGRVFFNL